MELSKKPTKSVLGRGLSALVSARPAPVTFPSQVPTHKPMTTETVVGSAALKPEDMPRLDTHKENNFTAVSKDTSSSVPRGTEESGLVYLDISLIQNNPSQPRQHFDEQELADLTMSIKDKGVLQPILVRPIVPSSGNSVFEVVAGERRWRAAKQAGLLKVPAFVREIGDRECLELAIIENVQRANLNPIEEAQSYQKLCEQFGLTHQEVADKIGKDRSTVANSVRILKLAPEVLKMITNSELSLGHAKVLLSLKEPSAQIRLAKKIIEQSGSVRALETLVAQAQVLEGQSQAALKGKGVTISGGKLIVTSFPESTDKLRNALGTKVVIRHSKSGKGKIEIEYFSEGELERLVDRIVG